MLQCSLILILHLVRQKKKKKAICSATTKESIKQSSTLPSWSRNNKGIDDGKNQVADQLREKKKEVKRGLDGAVLITAAGIKNYFSLHNKQPSWNDLRTLHKNMIRD